MEFMPTNDVFHHILLLLRLQDKEEIIEIFKTKGLVVTKSQVKAWQTKSGGKKDGYRPMPRHHLDLFISALHDARLLVNEDSHTENP